MRVDFSSQQSKADEVQQYLRLARIARGAMGAVIVAGIGFMAVASLPQNNLERGLQDASVNEMQLYAVPAEEGMRDVEPAPTAGSAAGTSDEELRGLTGVVHHG